MILKLSEVQSRRLRNALIDAVRDRKEFISCVMEPYRYQSKLPEDVRRQLAEEHRQIEFCRRILKVIYDASSAKKSKASH